jgi:hypothetical protein
MINYIAVFAMFLASEVKAGPLSGHARTEFRFSVNLPYDEAFPLFGAWAEQQWAPDWKPHFVYPNPPADMEGAVFQVNHGSHSSVWMMTRFDSVTGHVQYAFLINSAVMTRIDIKVKRNGSDKTDISVAYEWTATDASAAEHVRELAKQYEGAGAEWERQINAYAASKKGRF